MQIPSACNEIVLGVYTFVGFNRDQILDLFWFLDFLE